MSYSLGEFTDWITDNAHNIEPSSYHLDTKSFDHAMITAEVNWQKNVWDRAWTSTSSVRACQLENGGCDFVL